MVDIVGTNFNLIKMKRLILILSVIFQIGILNANADSIQTRTEHASKVHELKGKITYYGDKYKKTRRTANGDRFNKEAYTAPHKTLPFGTIVRVTNKRNGKSVVVRINDRGPFGPGRIIDVTPKAARDLDMIKAGVVPCELEILYMPETKQRT